ncbi:MAG TPA: tRNA guanosine(34) transglycosylase Tgt, partial [Pyrinomonadaceae bacterium]|nr:tRNA guanosine(34) transglycosylase Tgt [Pyrinomonadaceae bacterium]
FLFPITMTASAIKFEVIAAAGEARAGIIRTRRGVIETPVFMPVGTAATVKGIRFEELESSDLDPAIILGNTYHLWLRPGIETIKACGGLHRFMGWQRALLTDSGGFQVWSLGALRRVSEEGTQFRSHIDGSLRFLSPEVSMEVQVGLGSEIIMVFDECAPGRATYDEAARSMELTARWAKRSRVKFDELQLSAKDSSGAPVDDLSGAQALFGIVQGAGHLELRRESMARTVEIGFDGYAIGGLSVGEEKPLMFEIIDVTAPHLPLDKPRYLMGVGTPEDLVESVARGVDMFDCVLPTRNGRNGQAFTSKGKINIKNARWTDDTRPLDEACGCSVCRRHSRAYLRHLFLAGEMLSSILLTHHNLAFFLDTMRRVRQSIRSDDFQRFRREFIEGLSSNDN